MSVNKKYFWLKLKSNFFKQKEIKKLRKIAGGDTYTIIYLKLQLLSLDNEGKLFFDGVEDTFIEELALELDEDTENVRVTIMFLRRYGLIEEITENEYMLPEAAESIGVETQSTVRARKCRERQKALQCNTIATNCNIEKEIEKDIDIDIDIDIENKKKKPDGFSELIKSYTSNLDLKNTITEFIKMRKANKKVMTGRAIELMLEKLDKMASDDATKIAIINQSLENCWQGIFELKTETSKSQNNTYKTNMQKAYENIDWSQLEE